MGRLQTVERKFRFGFAVFVSLFRLFPLFFSDVYVSLGLAALTTAAAVGSPPTSRRHNKQRRAWLSDEVVNYKTGKIPGKFYLYLITKDEHNFWKEFMIASFAYLGLCLVYALMTFFSTCLYVQLRKNVVTRLHTIYYSRNFYYKLNAIDNEGIDNPDQRITQDVDKLTNLFATKILPTTLLAPFIITYYSIKTWETTGGWGVGMVFVYFLIGLVINRILVSPLTPWAARVEKCEGDFRYKHVSVRDNAEESAFAKAQDFERIMSEASFAALFNRLQWFIVWKFPSQFFQYFFDYYGAILSYALQVFPVFIFCSYTDLSDAQLSMQISNNAFYFIYLINCFTRLTDLAMSIGEMGGYVMRITELINRGKEHTYGVSNEGFSDIISNLEQRNEVNKQQTSTIDVHELQFGTPISPNNKIIDGLSFTLPSDKNLLITGPSGIGKTSLLRVIGNLWQHQHGSITKNFADDELYVLPQRCYFPVGRLSLSEQLLFPKVPEKDNKLQLERVVDVLNELKLTHLLAFCGDLHDPVDFEWQDTLSPGEQQRLCFARLLLANPRVAFVDEAASHVDEHCERVMYDLLRKNKVQFVSIGHRQTLREYHDMELRITAPNTFSFSTMHF